MKSYLSCRETYLSRTTSRVFLSRRQGDFLSLVSLSIAGNFNFIAKQYLDFVNNFMLISLPVCSSSTPTLFEKENPATRQDRVVFELLARDLVSLF